MNRGRFVAMGGTPAPGEEPQMSNQVVDLELRDRGMDDDGPPRTIDDYLEAAYRSDGNALRRRGLLRDVLERWRYYVIFLGLGIANSGDSAEMGCTNYILSSESFQHDILLKTGENGDDEIDFAGRGAAIAGTHLAGMMVSGLLAGVVADAWGRRSTLLLGLTTNAIVGMLSVWARNAAELCVLRFTLGVGLGMVIAGAVTLCAEVSPPSLRGRFMTLVASCYTLGYLYAAFMALMIFRVSGTGNWRLFMFLNALPTIAAAALVAACVPESPRFFLCRGQIDEAVRASNLIAAKMGGVDKPLREDELTGSSFRAKREGASCDQDGSRSLAPSSAVKEKGLLEEIRLSLAGIKQVYAFGMYKKSIPLQLSYFMLTLATGVTSWWTRIFQLLNLPTDAYVLSFYHTLAQIPGMMLVSGLIETGRRRLVMSGYGSAAVVLILLSSATRTIHGPEKEGTVAEGGSRGSFVVLGMACIYSVCLCVAWLSLDCLSTESFPTRVRSTGRGVCVATGRMAGYLVQFLYGPLIEANRVSRMFGLAGLFAVAGLAMTCRTTDTTDVGLQDNWDCPSGNGAAISNKDGFHEEPSAEMVPFQQSQASKKVIT